jgi:hypothetical protein
MKARKILNIVEHTNPSERSAKLLEEWSGRPGSNRRHPAWEAGVLPLNYSRSIRQPVNGSTPLPRCVEVSLNRCLHSHWHPQCTRCTVLSVVLHCRPFRLRLLSQKYRVMSFGRDAPGLNEQTLEFGGVCCSPFRGQVLLSGRSSHINAPFRGIGVSILPKRFRSRLATINPTRGGVLTLLPTAGRWSSYLGDKPQWKFFTSMIFDCRKSVCVYRIDLPFVASVNPMQPGFSRLQMGVILWSLRS